MQCSPSTYNNLYAVHCYCGHLSSIGDIADDTCILFIIYRCPRGVHYVSARCVRYVCPLGVVLVTWIHAYTYMCHYLYNIVSNFNVLCVYIYHGLCLISTQLLIIILSMYLNSIFLLYTNIHFSAYIYIYIYIYMCVYYR